MSSTYTHSQAKTFTITNAKYLASKVQTDLLRLHRYYYSSHGKPTIQEIQNYHVELVLLQVYNYLEEIEYGFVENNCWVKALKYTARQGGVLTSDEDPGGIRFSNVSPGAKFTSLLSYNATWQAASQLERDNFKKKNPVSRVTGTDYSGNWEQQRAYSSGGRGFLRSGI